MRKKSLLTTARKRMKYLFMSLAECGRGQEKKKNWNPFSGDEKEEVTKGYCSAFYKIRSCSVSNSSIFSFLL